MDLIGNIIKYAVYGFFGFIVFIFFMALLFGKRRITKWDYEADFYNDKRREIGEFEIKLNKYEKEEDFSLKASFRLRHPALTEGSVVQIYLHDVLVMEGTVSEEGRINLTNEHLKSTVDNPEAGQICRVLCSSIELFAEPIHRD